MTPSQLSERLAQRAETICRELLPRGRRNGHDWVAADLSGAPGDSLRVCLSGEKVGVWSDFATGQSGGDLLDLWGAVRGLTLREAMLQAESLLGIAPDAQASRPKRQYRRPERPPSIKALDPHGPAMAYLKSRGITEAALKAYKVAEQPGSIKFPKLADNPATLVFPYLRDGELLNCKYLALARPGGKKQTVQEFNAEPCLFGWQAISPNARAVTLCEGETDCLSLASMGIPALSVPMGGGGGAKQAWIESEYDRLEQFDTIFVWMDADEVGQAAAREIIKRLGAERCRLVETPKPHKDPNDCLVQGQFTQADFARVIMSARTADPEELKSASVFTNAVLHEFYPAPDTPMGLALPWRQSDDRIRFRPGEVTVWIGTNGHGKSLALNHLAAFGLTTGERFCIASMEMLPAKTLFRLVRQLTGREKPDAAYIQRCMAWLGDKLWLFDLVGTAKVNRMLEVFGYAAKRYRISQFIVDSLAKCGIGEDDYNGQKGLVDRLSDFAHQFEVHVHLVSHARKGQDENTPPGKMDAKGTGAITDLVDNVITVWRNKPKEAKIAQVESEKGYLDPAMTEKLDAALIVSKQRHGTGWEGMIALWFDPLSMQYLERAGYPPTVYVDGNGESDIPY